MCVCVCVSVCVCACVCACVCVCVCVCACVCVCVCMDITIIMCMSSMMNTILHTLERVHECAHISNIISIIIIDWRQYSIHGVKRYVLKWARWQPYNFQSIIAVSSFHLYIVIMFTAKQLFLLIKSNTNVPI